MKQKRVIMEENGYSEEFRQQETARAIKKILKSNSFIVMTRSKEGGNEGVSCIDGKDLVFMAYACKVMEENLLKAQMDIMTKGNENDNNEKEN